MAERTATPPIVTDPADTRAAGKASRAFVDTDRLLRRSRRSRRRLSKERKLRTLSITLAATLLTFVLSALLAVLHIEHLRDQQEELLVAHRKQGRLLAKLQAELRTVVTQRNALVKHRLPQLQRLVYDHTIPIHKKYIRNIIFTLIQKGISRAGQEKAYGHEYRIVMHNRSLSPASPRVLLLLFDEVGIQVGATEVDMSHAISPVEGAELAPDEVRTYSGTIERVRNRPPRYFTLDIQ
jgi:hypothetical protein